MNIYTPGHSVYTDTLILYGICKALQESFEEEFAEKLVAVERLGQQYELKIGVDVDELAEAIFELTHGEEDTMRDQLTSPRNPLGLFKPKDVDKALTTLRDLNGLKEYLRDLSHIGHIARYHEGRGGKGENVKLPLMPTAGKYLHRDATVSKKYATYYYKACGYCVALGLMGFLEATYPLSGRRGKVVVTIPFEGMSGARYFLNFFKYHLTYWKQFYEELRKGRIVDQLPGRTTMFLIVSLFSKDLVDSMVETPAGWSAVGVCFAGRPGAPEIRGLSELELTAFIEGLNRLYKSDLALSDLRNLMFTLASHGDADSLDALFEFISSGELGRFYEFVRGAYATLERVRLRGEAGWKAALSNLHRSREMARAILKGG